jgi:hypothetical protein
MADKAGAKPRKSRALAIPVPGPGRKSLYREEYADQARKLCLLGATRTEIAGFFEVSESTIDNWQKEHPAFLGAIREGKIQADANVADSLYRRATGEFVQMERIVKNSAGEFEAVRYKQFIPGDPQAAFRWLLNRRRQDWSDTTKHEHSGETTVVHKIELVAPSDDKITVTLAEPE